MLWLKVIINLPQSQQEDPGVQQQMPEVTSLNQPSADHSKSKLDEGNQTDILCGQHMTEVGSHEKPEDQGQESHHNSQLIQVMSSQTVPVSDSEMLLMTDVPEQSWHPLLPCLPKSNEDQSLPVKSTETSSQDSDYNSIHGDVNSDGVNSAHLLPPTPNKVVQISCDGMVDCLGGQSMADNLGNKSDKINSSPTQASCQQYQSPSQGMDDEIQGWDANHGNWDSHIKQTKSRIIRDLPIPIPGWADNSWFRYTT